MQKIWDCNFPVFTVWELWNSVFTASLLEVYYNDAYGCLSAMCN